MNAPDIWTIFPFPTRTASTITDGALWDAPDKCIACKSLECLSRPTVDPGAVSICPYGVSFSPVDDTRSVMGFVATDLPMTTKAAMKTAKNMPHLRAASDAVARSVDRARGLGAGVIDDYTIIKAEYLKNLDKDPQLHAALADELSKDFRDNLAQSHDFLQLVKLVRGHAESLLHEKYPELPPEEAAEHLPVEGAIYFSTSLMLVKMDSLVYLHEINRVHGSERNFQIHPFLVKYLRIYNWQAKQKDLDIHLRGTCYSSSFYNSQAIGSVLQALLDNMVKYAPAGTAGTVSFTENDDHVVVEFRSLGPRILPEERTKIFYPKFRAVAARSSESGGMGIGLATAKKISEALDLELSCTQENDHDGQHQDRYWTTFKFRLTKS